MHGAHALVIPSFSSDYDGGDYAFSIRYSILCRPHLTMACKRKVLERICGCWKLRRMKMLQCFVSFVNTDDDQLLGQCSFTIQKVVTALAPV